MKGMKKAAQILIPIFLILAIIEAVYLVLNDRMDIRKKASETNLLTTSFTQNSLKDWCSNGPIVELTATNGTYNTEDGSQTLSVKASRVNKNNLGSPITFTTLEIGCTGFLSNPNQCKICEPESPGYYNRVRNYIIPENKSEIEFQVQVSKISNLDCGCSQQNIHILSVNGESQDSCNTLIPRDSHKLHEYLAAETTGDNCKASDVINLPGPTVQPSKVIPTKPVLPTKPEENEASPSPKLESMARGIGVPQKSAYTPDCTQLTAYPNTGTIPLTVHFTGSGFDADGSLATFEFDFGDGKLQRIEKNIGESGSIEIDHTYTTIGSFQAKLKVKDDNNIWSESVDKCLTTVLTKSGGNSYGAPVLAAATTTTPSPRVTTTVTVTPTVAVSRTPTPTVVQPDVPVSGTFVPTIMVGLAGILIITLGAVLAL